MALPNLFLAGVPKAGTSSLFTWLADHPQAVGSHEKETCFFADPESHVFRPDFNAKHGIERYARAFPQATEETRVTLEATPSYIYSRTALDLIPDLPSKPRCLFVLREPAVQIRSLYDYFRDNWSYVPSGMSFAAFLDAVRSGSHAFGGNELAAKAIEHADYLPYLENWRARLGAERMMVATFDRLQADPRGLTQQVALWCGLDPAFYDRYGFEAENESYTPRSRGLQRLNIALRGRLPKGRLYDLARRAYRLLNTRVPDRSNDDARLAALRAEFAPANRRLAEAFDLDLSRWTGADQRDSMPS